MNKAQPIQLYKPKKLKGKSPSKTNQNFTHVEKSRTLPLSSKQYVFPNIQISQLTQFEVLILIDIMGLIYEGSYFKA